ncbi:MAG: hypothetical protein KDK97_02710 [Verrucomicrobiales bacterium]|nr:hypothetical protein [Verrucomicrobiales bacterium]MCP5556955.1 hypothetical protein [Verrucomicrobiaceae bacterium]
MKSFARVVRWSLLAVLASSLMACESSDKPKRRKPVAPTTDVSALPWNRPPKWEGSARYGGMVPQSR